MGNKKDKTTVVRKLQKKNLNAVSSYLSHLIPHILITAVTYIFLYIYRITNIHLALAKVIPVINGQINVICGEAPNHFIQVSWKHFGVECVRFQISIDINVHFTECANKHLA